MSLHDSPRAHHDLPYHSGLSRREVGKRLGLLGATFLLDGCGSLSRLTFTEADRRSSADPSVLTPDQFAEKAGTVETARANIAGGIATPTDFIPRFLFHSPRVYAATRPGGPIGSVLYNPKPATIAAAVNLQIARGKGEPDLLHNDLGTIAARQYAQHGARTFASIFPTVISIVGDAIHQNRALIQLVLTGHLPSEKIICTNQDMESLVGRQLTFASQMVRGIRCGTGMAPIQGSAIWGDDSDAPQIPEGTISRALAGALLRLEMTGHETKVITPDDPGTRPTGWQDVSEAYRNFAVGQFIEAEQSLTQHSPRNAFEKSVAEAALAEYQPYLTDVKKRLDWGHTCVQTYSVQKQDGRADLLMQPVFAHSVGARQQL